MNVKNKMTQVYGYGCRSGKRRYVTEDIALNDLLRINATPLGTRKPPRSVYRCPMCGGWHTTSKEYNP